jgi:hypothetical protein
MNKWTEHWERLRSLRKTATFGGTKQHKASTWAKFSKEGHESRGSSDSDEVT